MAVACLLARLVGGRWFGGWLGVTSGGASAATYRPSPMTTTGALTCPAAVSPIPEPSGAARPLDQAPPTGYDSAVRGGALLTPPGSGGAGRSGVTALSAGPAALSRLGLLRVLCRAVLGTWLVGGVALGRRVVRGLGRQARRDLGARLRVVVLAVTTGGQRQRVDGHQRSAGDQTLMADARACGSGSRSTDRRGATPPQQPPLPRSAPPTSISPAAPHTPPCPEPTTPDRAGRAQSAGSIRSPRKQERAHL